MSMIDQGEGRLNGTASSAHDAWFRAKVLEAMADPRPDIAHDDVEAYFARRREAASKLKGLPAQVSASR
jgi:hypothetical protein